MSLTIRLICAVFALLLTASAGFAAPAVVVLPNTTTPTARASVQGTGFGAFTAIDIYYDTTHLCITFANSVGAASCTIRIPKDAQPVYHWVSMIQRNNGTGAQNWHLVRTNWAQFHGQTAARNGRNPFENTLNASNVTDLDILWTAPIGPGGAWSTPAVAGGKVYIGGLDGNLYAFNSLTGATVAGFPKDLGGAVAGPVAYSSPAVGYGRVYIGTEAPDRRLHAFNATTGAAVSGFPIQLGGSVESSPALAHGNVYVGSYDGFLHAFNATTGVRPWPAKAIGGSVLGSPVVANGYVYIGAGNKIHGYNALTGASLPSPWPITLDLTVSFEGSASIAGGVLYIGGINGINGRLFAINAKTGLALPGFPAGAIHSSPAVGGGLVVFGSDDDLVYAFFTASGGKWTEALDDEVRGSPVIAGGLVYVNSSTRLYALSLSDGLILWSAGVATYGQASPAVSDGIVYLASTDGSLYAFSINGEPVSARRVGGALGVKPALSSLKPDLSLKP